MLSLSLAVPLRAGSPWDPYHPELRQVLSESGGTTKWEMAPAGATAIVSILGLAFGGLLTALSRGEKIFVKITGGSAALLALSSAIGKYKPLEAHSNHLKVSNLLNTWTFQNLSTAYGSEVADSVAMAVLSGLSPDDLERALDQVCQTEDKRILCSVPKIKDLLYQGTPLPSSGHVAEAVAREPAVDTQTQQKPVEPAPVAPPPMMMPNPIWPQPMMALPGKEISREKEDDFDIHSGH